MTETAKYPLICEAITEAFGERCPDFEPECWACKTWAEFDALTAALAPQVKETAPPSTHVAPIRWLVTNEVHGSTGWVVVEHEHDARYRADCMEKAGAINVIVTPLYAAPPSQHVRGSDE